jgi:hypothetical protein
MSVKGAGFITRACEALARAVAYNLGSLGSGLPRTERPHSVKRGTIMCYSARRAARLYNIKRRSAPRWPSGHFLCPLASVLEWSVSGFRGHYSV